MERQGTVEKLMQLTAALQTDEWAAVLPSFGAYAAAVQGDEHLRSELEKVRQAMEERNKSPVSFDAVAERSQVILTSMVSIFPKKLAEIAPIPSTPHINNLIDAIRAAELLLSCVQNSRHVFEIFNRWYFLLCPSYYKDSRPAQPSYHDHVLKEFLKMLGLMVCVVVPPDDALHHNFSGAYSWFKEEPCSSFGLSKAALRAGPDPAAGVSSIFGVGEGWLAETHPASEPATVHELCSMEVPLNFYHHVMQYTRDFRVDGGSFVSSFETRLLGVFEVFLSSAIGVWKQQLEECETLKAKFLGELQTKLFAAMQLAIQSIFHCFPVPW